MTKQREILSNGILFNCELCDKKDMKSTGFSNHVNSMHVKKENISSLEEYYKLYINLKWGNSNNLCKFCNKETKFMSIFEGYSEFCSHQCSVSTTEHKELIKVNYKISMLEKYGVEHSSKLSGFGDKVKATKLKKHGDENFNNIEKAKLTNLGRYGVENYAKSNEYVEKTKATSLEKYGVEHFTQNEEVKNKTKLTNLDRYGFENPMKNVEIYNKSKETNLKRYGVKHATQYEFFRNKTKKTLMEKYGVDSPLKLFHTRLKSKTSIRKKFEDNFNFLEQTKLKLLDSNELKFKCLVCNNDFIFEPEGEYKYLSSNSSTPSRFPHCKICNPVGARDGSSIQKEIYSYICSFFDKEKIKINDKSILKNINKQVDIYIENKNISFEINGLYWHSEIGGNKGKTYHVNKTNLSEAKNIKLIHIFEDEINDKNKIIKSKLDYLLNNTKNSKSIGARKCVIKKTNKKEYFDFYENNHLQGKVIGGNISYGAFYNNELVACMTFGQERISLGSKNHTNKNEFELLRFCTKIGYVIPGVASRLFSRFIKENNPNKIISYADRRWSSSINKDTVYQKLGFTEVHKSEPNYFYLLKEDNYRKRHNRYKFRKSELNRLLSIYDPALSEWENMKNNGHDRIWDCGTIKYEWKNKTVQENIELGSSNS